MWFLWISFDVCIFMTEKCLLTYVIFSFRFCIHLVCLYIINVFLLFSRLHWDHLIHFFPLSQGGLCGSSIPLLAEMKTQWRDSASLLPSTILLTFFLLPSAFFLFPLFSLHSLSFLHPPFSSVCPSSQALLMCVLSNSLLTAWHLLRLKLELNSVPQSISYITSVPSHLRAFSSSQVKSSKQTLPSTTRRFPVIPHPAVQWSEGYLPIVFRHFFSFYSCYSLGLEFLYFHFHFKNLNY